MTLRLPATPVQDPLVQMNFDVISVQWDAPPKPGLVTTFVNGWRNFAGGGGANQDARYYRTREGIVHLEGLLDKNGGNWVANEPMFTLPAGFRPPKNMLFLGQAASNAGAALGTVAVDVSSAGNVLMGGFGGAANPVYYLSISLVRFSVYT